MEQVKSLQKYWQLIALGVAFITAWANIQSTIKNIEVRTGVLETKLEAQTAQNIQILVQLSQMQTDLQWIKSRLSQ